MLVIVAESESPMCATRLQAVRPLPTVMTRPAAAWGGLDVGVVDVGMVIGTDNDGGVVDRVTSVDAVAVGPLNSPALLEMITPSEYSVSTLGAATAAGSSR